MYDTIIIGAGVIGANIARELARYDLRIAVLESMSDVCEATSKGNSGIVHSGYDAKPGTLKAKYNMLGNKMMAGLCRRLNIPYRNNGSLTIIFRQEDMSELERLRLRGLENGVEGLKILNREQTLEIEPELNEAVQGSLYAPTAGIVDPFQLTIGPAEIAQQNGVDFRLGTMVTSIEKLEKGFLVKTNRKNYEALTIINASGVFADDINNWLSQHKYTIKPRKGEYCLFDKEVGNLVTHTIFQLPVGVSKGVLVAPTAEGNLLVGPNSLPEQEKNDTLTSSEGIKYILDTAKKSVKNLPTRQIITGFAGLRASEIGGDFVLGQAEDVPGFFNCLGIESPGLTAAPAIAVDMASWVAEYLKAKPREKFIDERMPYHRFSELSTVDKKKLFEADHDYGKVICRCELVTLAEIKNAIHRPLGATTLDGVKRRTRAGSGRCQGGFCSPRILEILSQELHKDIKEIVKSSEKSTYLVGLDKDML